jgi:hypothetical protein
MLTPAQAARVVMAPSLFLRVIDMTGTVNLFASTAYAAFAANLATKAELVKVTAYGVPGTFTFTKDPNTKEVYVVCIGGGNGGQRGDRLASGVLATGGGGGGGGGWSDGTFAASALGATETVIVGAGSVGSVGATVDNTGRIGAPSAGASSFGSFILAPGGIAGAGGVGGVLGGAGGAATGSGGGGPSTFPLGVAPGGGSGGGGKSVGDIIYGAQNGGTPGTAMPAVSFGKAAAGQNGGVGPNRAVGDIRGGAGGAGGSFGFTVGAEMLPAGAGDFTSGASWTLAAGYSITGNALVCTVANNTAYASVPASPVNGAIYLVSFEITSYTSGTIQAILYGTDGFIGVGAVQSGVGTYSQLLTVSGTGGGASNLMTFHSTTSSFLGTIDNVSVKSVAYTLGSEIVANGTFNANDTTGWTASAGSIAGVGNALEISNGTSIEGRAALTGVLPSLGGAYLVTFDLVSVTGGGGCAVALGGSGRTVFPTTVGTHSMILSSLGLNQDVLFVTNVTTTGAKLTIDNVSVKRVNITPSPSYDGGAGGFPGGGGGGGGASLNGANSGAGGPGADGTVVIFEYA